MLLSERARKFLLFWWALLMPIEVWASLPKKAVEIRLPAEVELAGDAVVLGQVATIFARRVSDFQQLSQMILGQLPADGASLRLPASYLRARVRELLPAGTEFTLHAPEVVVFRNEKKSANLAAAAVPLAAPTPSIETTVAAGGASSAANLVPTTKTKIGADKLARHLLEVAQRQKLIPAWAEAKVEVVGGLEGVADFHPERMQIEALAGVQRWKGDFSAKITDGSRAAWVRARARWFADVWVASRPLPARTELTTADFKTARAEITAQAEDPILASADLAQHLRAARARRFLKAEAPLGASFLERAPDARAGQALKVVFVSESGIRVVTEGMLIGAGVVGEEVRAKLRSSRKVITGRLVNGGAMEVSL